MCGNCSQKVYLFYTGQEAQKSQVPFLLDPEMRPIRAVNSWLRNLANDGGTSSFHTRRAYAYDLYDFFNYLVFYHLDWKAISNDTLVHYRDLQDENLSAYTKKPLNRRTINSRISSISRFYLYAAAEEFIPKNPLRYKTIRSRRPADTTLLAHLGNEKEIVVPSVAYERLPRPKIKWRPHHEVMKWINSIYNWRDKLISKFAYRTGMRREEIVSLRISSLPSRDSIDLGSLEIPFEIIGKGNKKRTIYCATKDVLELHDYIRIERALILRKAKTKHDYIFVLRNGNRIRPSYLNRIFRRISEACGIEITPHMLRHSFAVFALSCWKKIGVSQPEKLLQSRLGHASNSTTQIYMHMTDEDLANEAYANSSLIEHFLKEELYEDE